MDVSHISGVQLEELQATGTDGDVVADLNLLIPQLSGSAEPLTEEWLREVLDSGTRIFTAWHESHIIGTVLLCTMKILVAQKDWIEDVVVESEYQRRGIASQLMDMAEAASREGKAKSINLTSKPERHGARTMYGERGYVERDTTVFRLPL